ncbi:MAG TPA: hypothetical protein VFL78_10680 [Rhodanobacteraceae bacterium]|nr:hypothetical protein [Rhodanobacteraceae bacterium]
MNAKQPAADTRPQATEAKSEPVVADKPTPVRSPHTRERDPAKRKAWKRERAKALGDLPADKT